MTKLIKIASLGLPHDYSRGLLPLIINHLGYGIDWVKPKAADLVIYGPFWASRRPKLRWLPRVLRPYFEQDLDPNRHSSPLRLFHTYENLRHDAVLADFSISFDLGVSNPNHYRFPYWMDLVDWSHEGIKGNQNPRYGRLLNLDRLLAPLGNHFLEKPGRAAFFSSHLREPRKTLYEILSAQLPVDGMGPGFNGAISDHHQSGFEKFDVLKNYRFNLCPENSAYPGYVTEKIPEAFMADALPISWVDTNATVDFNPEAYINLLPNAWQGYDHFMSKLGDRIYLEHFVSQSLLITRPSIEPFKAFVKNIVQSALG
jgi:Glycosyltransferase family 10 (fucosyltransferase) C-term